MSLGCLCCNIMPFNAPKTLDNYMYICSINLVEHRFFEPSWEKQLERITGRFEKSRVNIQCLTGDGKLSLVRIIGNQGFKIGEGVSVQRLSIITDLY